MSALADFEKLREMRKSIRTPEWRLPLLLSPKLCKPVGMRRLLQPTLHNKIGHERDMSALANSETYWLRLHVGSSSPLFNTVFISPKAHWIVSMSVQQPIPPKPTLYHSMCKNRHFELMSQRLQATLECQSSIHDEACVVFSSLLQLQEMTWHGECRD